MIPKTFDLRRIDTRWALTDAERQAIRRQRQREALGLSEPRVKISSAYLEPHIAKHFTYINVRGLV